MGNMGEEDGGDFVLLFGGPRFCFHLESGCVCLAVRMAELPDSPASPSSPDFPASPTRRLCPLLLHRWAWAGAWATGDSRRNVWCGAVRYGMSNVYLPVIKFENDLNFTSEYSKLVLTLSFAASLRLVSLFFFCFLLPIAHPQPI